MTGIIILASGIFLQLLMLLGRPVYRLVKTKEKNSRVFLLALILIRVVWAIFVYWSIWYALEHPEQWPLDLPGSALFGYTAIAPIFILTFDWILMMLIGIAIKIFNSKFDADVTRRST
jgi:hypothetical protein